MPTIFKTLLLQAKTLKCLVLAVFLSVLLAACADEEKLYNGLSAACALNATTQKVFELHNKARVEGVVCPSQSSRSLPEFKLNCALTKASFEHASNMVNKGYFSHVDGQGKDVGWRASKFGYAWKGIAENLAKGPMNPSAATNKWLASEGHCKNIANSKYTEIGLAKVDDIWVVMFGQPAAVY